MPAQGADLAKPLESLPPGARILLIRLRSLGDTLLVTPALGMLKRWRPDLRLSMVLQEEFAPILASNPDVEDVIVLKRGGVQGALSVLSAQRLIRRRRYAACFNLHGGTLSALLTATSGTPYRLAAGPFRFRWVYTGVAPHSEEVMGRRGLHTVEHQLSVFCWAGLPLGEIPPLQLFPQPEARQAVQKKLAAAGLNQRTCYAVMVPTARFFTKEWPFERYAAVVRYLKERYGLETVLDCSPGDEWKLDAVDKACGRRLPRLVPLSIQELAALIEGAALFLGNDSGPMHIAAALQRPMVVLFGSSEASVWRPWRAPSVVLENPYTCRPCPADRCYAFDRPECILSITEEQVRAAIDSLLANEATRE